MNVHQLTVCYLNLIIFTFILYQAYFPPPIKLQPCPSLAPFLTKPTQSSSTISETQRGLFPANHEQELAKESIFPHLSGLGQVRKSNGSIQASSTWTTMTSYVTMSMVTTRSRLGNNGQSKIEELRLVNKKINNKIRRKNAEEEKKKAKAKRAVNLQLTEDAPSRAATITPRNLHNLLNGGNSFNLLDIEANTDEVESIMESKGAENEANDDTSGRISPLKKRRKGKKRSSS